MFVVVLCCDDLVVDDMLVVPMFEVCHWTFLKKKKNLFIFLCCRELTQLWQTVYGEAGPAGKQQQYHK